MAAGPVAQRERDVVSRTTRPVSRTGEGLREEKRTSHLTEPVFTLYTESRPRINAMIQTAHTAFHEQTFLVQSLALEPTDDEAR